MIWKELQELLIGEYANEGTAIETIRSHIKLVQLRDETLGELGVRMKKGKKAQE